MAEASLQLNGVFEAAKSVIAQYLENIQRQTELCAEMEKQSHDQAEKLWFDAKIKCNDMEAETRKNVKT